MSTTIDTISGCIISALLNGTYQGLLITLLILSYLRLNHKLNAATRHALLLATLGVVMALPVAHSILFLGKAVSKAPTPAGLKQTLSAPLTSTTASIANRPPIIQTIDGTQSINPPSSPTPNPGPHPFVARGHLEDEHAAETSPRPLSVSQSVLVRETHTSHALETTAAARSSKKLQQLPSIVPTPAQWTLWKMPHWGPTLLLGFWGAISGSLFLRLTLQFFRLRMLKRKSGTPSQEYADIFDRLSVRSSPGRSPRLLISSEISIPLAAGFLHPAVIFPADLVDRLDAKHLEALLRHELAHIARRDDWANLSQLVAEAAFFFHPAVWLLSRRLQVEREIAADDHVLQAATSPKSYALLLTEFVRRRSGRPWAPATGAWSQQSQLKERINMILNSQRNTSPLPARTRVSALTLGAVLLALAGFRLGPRVALADTTTPASIQALPPSTPTVSSAVSSPTPAKAVPNAPKPVPTSTIRAVSGGAAMVATLASDSSGQAQPIHTTLQVDPTAQSIGADAAIGSVNSGPRIKDDAPQATPTPSGDNVVPNNNLDLAAPAAPSGIIAPPPTPGVPGAPSGFPGGGQPGPGIYRPRSGYRRAAAGYSGTGVSAPENLEQRMMRLEKLMAELQSRQQLPPPVPMPADAAPKGLAEAQREAMEAKLEAEQAAKEAAMEANSAAKEAAAEAEQAAREAKEAILEAHREAEEARREADEARREAKEKRMRVHVEAMKARQVESKSMTEDFEAMRQDLLKQKEDLSRQLAEIDRELAKLKSSVDSASQRGH